MIPGFAEVEAAAGRLRGRVVHTPMLRHALLDELTGGTVLVKPEPLQRTGSFKLRGATNAVLGLSEQARKAGVVTYSSGNHGQAVACAAASAGISATVVMPLDAPAIKRRATEAWGARVILYDRLREDREAIARGIAARTGAAIIPPFDHPHVIAGQGTLALELFEDARIAGLALDRLLVPAGGGGLIAGCALAAEGVSPGTVLHPVEPVGWDDTARSLAAGEILGNDGVGSLFCDALLSPRPGQMTFAINRQRLAPGLVVSDDAVRAAMCFAFAELKLVVEPGGAVALAAVLSGRLAEFAQPVPGMVIGIVLSGGNVDPAVAADILQG